MSWILAILKAVGAAFGLYKSVQEQNTQTMRDNLIRSDQSNRDALQGESDALKQVDNVNKSVDSGGVRIAVDPYNDNR